MQRISAIALFALSACAGFGAVRLQTDRAAVEDGLASWRRVVEDSTLSSFAVAAELERLRRGPGVLLSLWPAQNLPDSVLARLYLSEHPCGENALLVASRIPRDTTTFVGEIILEYDDDGRFVRRWRVPTDEVPVGLRGGSLLLGGPRPGVVLAVEEDGRFAYVADSAQHPGTYVPCPRVPALEPSDYLQCTEFIDRGRVRRLAYQGVCT